MQRLLFILLFITIIHFPLQAQSFWKGLLPQIAKKEAVQSNPAFLNLSEKQISQILETRVQQTFTQAQKAEGEVFVFDGQPIRGISPMLFYPLKPHKTYPGNLFLTTNKQAKKFFIINNNQAFLSEVQRMKKFWPALEQALPKMQQEAASLQQPKDPLTWLAQAIPAATDYLFLGEYHTFSEIQISISRLLSLIRERNPNREIFVFTEFLPDSTKYMSSEEFFPSLNPLSSFTSYHPIWQTALQNNMPVIGLEESYVRNSYATVKEAANTESEDNTLWSTLEGMRLRNKHWAQIIEKYRKKHPNALFVIYTGAGHCFYNYFFPLSKMFPGENSFVVELAPQKEEAPAFPTARTGLLEILQDKVAFAQPVLKWKDPSLKELSGFDAHIKIQVKTDKPLYIPHVPSTLPASNQLGINPLPF